MRNPTYPSLGRNGWKQVLASVVVGLTVSSTAIAQENQGRLFSALLERFDVDADGKLSQEERQQMRAAVRARGGRADEISPTVPDHLKSLYRSSTGPHAIDSIATVSLPRPDDDQKLQLRVTYPKSTGKFPVIVFSHGAFGSKDAYDPIVRHWASYGYVVIQPTHGDSLSLLTAANRMKVVTSRNPFSVLNVGKHWKSRAQEVALITKSLAQLESAHPALRGKLDATKIGVGGHSYGGNTTQLVGGLNLGADLKVDGIKALLMLSPPGPNELVSKANFREITAPTMVVTGTKDKSPRTGQGYEWRLETYNSIPSAEKFLLFIKDAEHNLGGVSGSTGRLAGGGANDAHLTYVKSATTAFWDSFLRSEGAARKFIESNQMAEASQDGARLSKN